VWGTGALELQLAVVILAAVVTGQALAPRHRVAHPHPLLGHGEPAKQEPAVPGELAGDPPDDGGQGEGRGGGVPRHGVAHHQAPRGEAPHLYHDGSRQQGREHGGQLLLEARGEAPEDVLGGIGQPVVPHHVRYLQLTLKSVRH